MKPAEMMELLSQLDMERTGAEGDDARSLRAQLEYLQGDTEAAFRWADDYPAAVPDRLLNWLQDPHLVKASLLRRKGNRSRSAGRAGHPGCPERDHRAQLLHAAADRDPRSAGGGAREAGEEALPHSPRSSKRWNRAVRAAIFVSSSTWARSCRPCCCAWPAGALHLRPSAASWPRFPSRSRRSSRPRVSEPALPTPASSNLSPNASWTSSCCCASA